VSILIVGGAGYLGGQPAKRVAHAGLTRVVFDNLVYGHKGQPFVEGDLADGRLHRRSRSTGGAGA
jgi:UDP-glucose 4-epimerase